MTAAFSQNARHTVWDRAEYQRRQARTVTPEPLAARIMANYEASYARAWHLWLPKQPPGRAEGAQQGVTPVHATEAPQTAECATCGKLRAELSHAKLDVSFWKGETDLAKSGTEAVRAVFDAHGISTGMLVARAEKACRDRDEALRRALSAENALQTLKARHQVGESVNDSSAAQTGKTN